MLVKPSLRVINALGSLEGNPNFVDVMAWLQESLDRLNTDSRSIQNEVVLRWTQGAAQTVSDFIEKAATARDVINKSR